MSGQTRGTDPERAGGLRQTSVAILNIDTDVKDRLKRRSRKAAQQLQIPLIFVCDDGLVTARNELVQKCLCLDVRHELQNVEQAPQHVRGMPVDRNCVWTRRAQGYQRRTVAGTTFFKCRATPLTCPRCLSWWSSTKCVCS